MVTFPRSPSALKCCGVSLVLTAALVDCAVAATKVANPQAANAPSATTTSFDSAVQHNVQAVSVPAAGPDGQASWIIQTTNPQTPKLAGAQPELPPHITRQMNYAFDLAQRGATYSATTEFQAVVGLCA